MLEHQMEQLAEMVVLVRGELTKQARTTIGALTVVDVHARDVMKKLVFDHTEDKQDFNWISQMRYYWEEDHLWALMVASRRQYGYEYLGNSFRLVITPLTDKCYLTLMGALQMVLGGAPAGPAGTGARGAGGLRALQQLSKDFEERAKLPALPLLCGVVASEVNNEDQAPMISPVITSILS